MGPWGSLGPSGPISHPYPQTLPALDAGGPAEMDREAGACPGQEFDQKSSVTADPPAIHIFARARHLLSD